MQTVRYHETNFDNMKVSTVVFHSQVSYILCLLLSKVTITQTASVSFLIV